MAPNPRLSDTNGLRVAVEGCGHGVLHSIFASVDKACEEAGWPGVDLLIIGGDFQAVRNADDFACVSMPPKYRDMQDFHEYYSGKRKAPYLTIFVGGNHEASNYMFELHYGGWVAPNIYYMGAANVLRVGPLRIAGMSGIWKGYDYKKPHFERLPYNQDDVKSVYHTREEDVRKLLCLRSQVDIGISHDWPRAIEWKGNYRQLFRIKNGFEQDARDGRLGNVAAKYVLDRLRPPHWFSAHLHVKYSAVLHHEVEGSDAQQPVASNGVGDAATINGSTAHNEDEIDLDLDEADDSPANGTRTADPANADEIDLDLDDGEDTVNSTSAQPTGMNGAPEPTTEEKPNEQGESAVPETLRAQLPSAFTKSKTPPPADLPFPAEITNKTTKFLALDKCLPHRSFLQLLAVPSLSNPSDPISRPVKLEYDTEWLAITRVFGADLNVGDPQAAVPADKGEAHYRPLIEAEEKWVQANIVGKGLVAVPETFTITAPVYDEARGLRDVTMPREYTNPQTAAFCNMLDIPNPFDISEAERDKRMAEGPRPAEARADGGSRGGFGGRGRGGGGRGRGARGRGFGRGGHGRSGGRGGQRW